MSISSFNKLGGSGREILQVSLLLVAKTASGVVQARCAGCASKHPASSSSNWEAAGTPSLHLSTIIFMQHSGNASHPRLPLVTCSYTWPSLGSLPGGSWHRHWHGLSGFRAPCTEKNQGPSSQHSLGAPRSAVSGRRGTQRPVKEAVWSRRPQVRIQHHQQAAKHPQAGWSPLPTADHEPPSRRRPARLMEPQEWA